MVPGPPRRRVRTVANARCCARCRTGWRVKPTMTMRVSRPRPPAGAKSLILRIMSGSAAQMWPRGGGLVHLDDAPGVTT